MRTMDKPRSIALTLLGFVVLVLVLWNSKEGLWVEGGTGIRHKLVLSKMLTGGCPQGVILADMQGTGGSACLTGRGSFDLTDLVLGLGGLMLFLGGIHRLLTGDSATGPSVTNKRHSWELMASGGALAAFGLMDFIGLLSPGSSPLDWAEVIGLPLPASIVDAACIGGGAFIFRKGSLENSKVTKSEQGQIRPREKIEFRGSLEKRVDAEGEDFTIGDMKDLLGFEDDPFFAYDPDEVESAMKICLFCSGEGCKECDWYGS